MKNRKGFNKKGEGELLPEATIKLIIAVICIAALIILVVLIYFSITGSQDIKKAQAVTSRFADEVKRINAGEIDSTTLPVPNPSRWHIFSFIGQDIKPNSCAGESCLCVCEKLTIGIFNVDSRQAQRCDKKGSCIAVPNLEKFNPIEIKAGGIIISIKKVNDLIEII